MISNIDDDRIELKGRVEDALKVLMQQMLVQKNGSLYVFLTDEEQEINREIDSQNVEMAEVINKVSEMIFEDIFTDKKYRYARVYVGKNNSLDITYKKPISKDFSDDDVQRGLIHIQSGELFGASLMNRIPTLYYDGIRCFLYQGICDALELKCEGININHRRERLFN